MPHITGPFTGIGVAPYVLSALALSSSRVRLFFSERMSPTGLATPGNYTITEDFGSDPRVVATVTLGHPTQPNYVDLQLPKP